MSPNTSSTLIPSLRYRNALAAIDWLGRAFGLQKHASTTTARSSTTPSSPAAAA